MGAARVRGGAIGWLLLPRDLGSHILPAGTVGFPIIRCQHSGRWVQAAVPNGAPNIDAVGSIRRTGAGRPAMNFVQLGKPWQLRCR